MAALGDHRVAELLVEVEIPGKLAADADADYRITFGAGIAVDPLHQRPPYAPALAGGIDGDAPHVQGVGLAIEPQAGNRLIIEQGQRPACGLEITADRCLRFPQSGARRVEPTIFPKGQLGQPMNDASIGRLAQTNLEPYQFDSMSIRPLRRAVRSAQPKTRCARISVAAVVTNSRNRTSASDKAGNIRIACEPSRLRRISSIQ